MKTEVVVRLPAQCAHTLDDAMMDQSLAEILGKLLAVLGLVAANGFFVAAEFSLVGVRRSRIDER